jgi:translation initiation factor IF-2
MYDFRGKRIKEAGPATPVVVAGLNGIPEAGDQFHTVESEKVARKIVAEMLGDQERNALQKESHVTTLDEFFSRLQEGENKTLNLIIKADVQGSLEPIITSLTKLSNEEVAVDILRSATGNVTESDVMLASASDAIVLGFNVTADPIAEAAAASEGVEIRHYSIIYQMIENVEKAIKGMLAPTYEDVVIGRAEVRQIFKVRVVGQVAGSFLRTGVAQRNSQARVIRGGKLLHTGRVGSLRHLTDNVREVKAGFEFGVSVEGFNDFRPGDFVEFFVSRRVEI